MTVVRRPRPFRHNAASPGRVDTPQGKYWFPRRSYNLPSMWDLAYGGPPGAEKLVACALNGEMLYSTDAVTWNRGIAPRESFQSLAYLSTANIWATVQQSSDGNRASYSFDGQVWTPTSLPSFSWNAVRAGAGVLLAKDGDGNIATSADGITWSVSDLRAILGLPPNSLRTFQGGITYDGPPGSEVFAFVGNDSFPSNMVYIYTSPDGVSWARAAIAPFNPGQPVYSGPLGLWVVPGAPGSGTPYFYSSPDLVTWAGISTPAVFNFYAQTIGGWGGPVGEFLLCENLGGLAASPDGVTWTPRSTGLGWSAASALAWVQNLGLWVQLGQTGTSTQRVATSPDGVSWTAQTISPVPGGVPMTSGAGAKWFPAFAKHMTGDISGTGGVYYSENGLDWIAASAPNLRIGRLLYGGPPGSEVLLAVSRTSITSSSGVLLSTDGVTFTPVTMPTTDRPGDAAWSPTLGLFCVCFQSGTNRIATSPDGVTWTPRAITARTFRGIAWGGPSGAELFVAISSGTAGAPFVIHTSPDGITWTPRAAPTGVNFSSYPNIIWSSDHQTFIASGGGTNSIIVSPDGITWASPTVNGFPGGTWLGEGIVEAGPPSNRRTILINRTTSLPNQAWETKDGVNFYEAPWVFDACSPRTIWYGGPPGNEKYFLLATLGANILWSSNL